MKFTDKDIDSLLATVEASLVKAETLAKAFPDKKDDAPADAPPAAPAADAPADVPPPAMDKPADAPADVPPPAADAPADQPPVDAPPAEGQAPEGQEGQPSPDQQLEGEGQEAPLSDEELDQIYGSLDPQELERHYMAIRKHLQGAYAKAEMDSDKKDEDKKDEDKEEDKVEKSEVVELKKKNAEMEKTLESLTKAIELLAQPKRKAVTSVGNLGKSEDSFKPTSKAEIKSKLTELTKSASLSKSERESINSYCLYGNGEKEIVNIIQKFEGSK